MKHICARKDILDV